MVLASNFSGTMALIDSENQLTSWSFPAGSLRWPLLIAHRGHLSKAPENTLPAFQQALDAGADGVELDVRLTRDGQLVVFHDRKLDRTSDGCGPVDHYTLADLRSLDAGSWFSPDFNKEPPPTLDQVFESLPHDFLINVEMKVIIDGMKLIAHRVAETIRRHRRWESTLVASFNPVALYHLRRMEPRVSRGYIWSKRHPFPIRSRFLSPLVQPQWFDPAHDSYNLRLHRKFHRQAQRVLAWDLDLGGDLERMAAARLDAVVTDDLEALVRQKLALTQEATGSAD